jgi:hypothetical protein
MFCLTWVSVVVVLFPRAIECVVSDSHTFSSLTHALTHSLYCCIQPVAYWSEWSGVEWHPVIGDASQ